MALAIDAGFFGEHAFGSFFEGRTGEDFVGQFHGRGNQGELTAHGALHQHLDDEHAVDFVGAFEDAIDARIAIGAANRIIFVEAVAAENLHGFVDDEVQHFAAVDFGDGTFDGVFLERFHGVLRFVAGAGRGVHGRFHIAGAAINHGFHGENAGWPFRRFFL